ncbi:MAG: A/G-specific adenine glycosylase [Ruminococcaceae bacterium]|nr:A/G-specific adenine glycosylase [Oscillospiraceae bacterium]
MQQNINLSTIVEPLLAWYEQNKRPLPWREAPDPYHVWLSEIMLQQTRIEAVIPYYERFLQACPTVCALAEIEDDKLMKLWEGLGYYSRARNLKKAAGVMVERYGGQLPADYEALLSLPGIGAYTAGAIASIAFGLPEPAVDGNVLRVITRLCADEDDVMKQTTRSRVSDRLRMIYPSEPDRAAAMTQALMELGEQVCIPNGAPRCQSCPLGATCLARAKGLTDVIPHRAPKKSRRIQQRTVFLLLHEGKVALRRREDKGLLSGLWEFPGEECHLDEAQAADLLEEKGIRCSRIRPLADAVHIFTHVEWHMKGYAIHCREVPWESDLVFVTPQEIRRQYALPTAFRAFARALEAMEEKDAP